MVKFCLWFDRYGKARSSLWTEAINGRYRFRCSFFALPQGDLLASLLLSFSRTCDCKHAREIISAFLIEKTSFDFFPPKRIFPDRIICVDNFDNFAEYCTAVFCLHCRVWKCPPHWSAAATRPIQQDLPPPSAVVGISLGEFGISRPIPWSMTPFPWPRPTRTRNRMEMGRNRLRWGEPEAP